MTEINSQSLFTDIETKWNVLRHLRGMAMTFYFPSKSQARIGLKSVNSPHIWKKSKKSPPWREILLEFAWRVSKIGKQSWYVCKPGLRLYWSIRFPEMLCTKCLYREIRQNFKFERRFLDTLDRLRQKINQKINPNIIHRQINFHIHNHEIRSNRPR